MKTDAENIFNEAPQRPGRSGRFFATTMIALLLLLWSFQGAKLRPDELVAGIPQIVATLRRMLPPDFAKIIEAKNYFIPENLSLQQLLIPVPLPELEERARQRWWDNTFPQTVLGATLETVQMALAGTFLALLAAFPLGFLAARNTTPHPLVYYTVRG